MIVSPKSNHSGVDIGTESVNLHLLFFDKQHLSYDGCLEVRGEIIRTVLCCIVY